ncbi:DnaJ protein-like protein xdj1 [Yarrowia sp. C11]|nr:DnaJ protein-like protein xdj1 [Yarrowia sp. C11]
MVNYTSENLYIRLGLSKDASSAEIKKVYRKLALESHPDKVAEDERGQAEIKFKAYSEAYEILIDDDKRAAYDYEQENPYAGNMYGGGGGYQDFDPQDFASFFNNMDQGPRPNAAKPMRSKRTGDLHVDFSLTLEELYKGKVLKMGSSRKILCSVCSGVGARKGAKPRPCGVCAGEGYVKKIQRVGRGYATQSWTECDTCKTTGKTYRKSDKCAPCGGSGTEEESKILEFYVPPGTKDGDTLFQYGETDELPGMKPGDIVAHIKQTKHAVFTREGQDLHAEASISLGEALSGFSKIMFTQLDGRGLRITSPAGNVIKPGDILKVANEGMPSKSGKIGSLYVKMNIVFPESGWSKERSELRKVLDIFPGEKEKEQEDPRQIVDDVSFKQVRELPQYKNEEENTMPGVPDCQTQ